MAGAAIGIGHARSRLDGRVVRIALAAVLMGVVPGVGGVRSTLVLAERPHRSPGELQRHQHQQKDHEPRTHGGIVKADSLQRSHRVPSTAWATCSISAAMSSRIGMVWNALMLERPALPSGNRPVR